MVKTERMQWLPRYWQYFWFEPASPANLALCRILFFGVVFLLYLRRNTSVWAEVPDVFWMPILLFKVFHLPMLSGNILVILNTVWKAALGLSCVGLLTRFSTVVSCILGVYLLGLPNNFGKTNHSEALVVLIMGIMAFSNCGDSWSVDRLIRRARSWDRPSAVRQSLSGEYTWPIRLVWVLFVLVFFGAGISKLRHSGLAWILSDNMAFLLIRHHYSHRPLTALGLQLAQYSWLCQFLAATTVGLEIGSPLALFSRKLRPILLLSLFFMQIGIWALLGVLFLQFLFCYLFWMPWELLVRRLTIRR